MATETFIIRVVQQGASQASDDFKKIGDSAKRSADTLAFFRKALVALSAVRAASHLIDFADAATRLDNRLKVATHSQEEFVRAQQFVSRVSRENYADIEATAVVYSRLLRSTENTTLTTKDLEDAMEAATLAIRVGGATSAEATAGLIQFSQGLASGQVTGQELNSVVEQLPALADAIGKEFGVAGGQLKNFAKQNPGILNTEKVVRGLVNGLSKLREESAKMTPTLGNAFTVLSNNAIEMVRAIQNSTGVLSILAKTIIFVADNLAILTTATIAFGVALTANKVAGIISAFLEANNVIVNLVKNLRLATAAQTLFNAVVGQNPYIKIAVAILAVITALALLYNNFESVRTAVAAIYNAFGEFVTVLYNIGVTIINAVYPALTSIGKVFEIIWSVTMAFGEALYNVGKALVAFGNWVYETLKPMMQFTPLGALIIFVVDNMATAFKDFGDVLGWLAHGFNLLVTTGIAPVVLAYNGLINVMNDAGLVSDETRQKVNAETVEFFKHAVAVAANTAATDALKTSNTNILGSWEEMIKKLDNFRTGMDSSTGSIKKNTEALDKNKGVLKAWSLSAEAATYWADKKKKADEAAANSAKNWNSYLEKSVSLTKDMSAASTGLSYAANDTAQATADAANGIASMGNAGYAAAAGLDAAADSARQLLNISHGFNDWFGTGQSSGTKLTFATARAPTDYESYIAQQVQSTAQKAYEQGLISSRELQGYLTQAENTLNGINYSVTGPGINQAAEAPISEQTLQKLNKIIQKAAGTTTNSNDPAVTATNTLNNTIAGAMGAGGTLTTAVNANTAAQVASLQTIYDMLDLARQNVSPYYGQTDQALAKDMAYRNLIGYAKGFSGVVGGETGVDKNLVQFMATRGEEVHVLNRQQQRQRDALMAGYGGTVNQGGTTINLFGVEDFDSFQRNRAQLSRGMSRAQARATKRLGY